MLFTALCLTSAVTTLIVVLAVFVVLLAVFFALVPVGTWFRALVSGARISMGRLIGMRLRRINIRMIVEAYINAVKAGLEIDVVELETHYMAGGDVLKAIDLAGRDVLNAVKVSVNPKVIETPAISAIAKNGIELRVKARVTVRANIARLVGGAGEETIIARVGEGIVTTIGSSNTHEEVLENPDRISKTVLQKGLDAGTAFEILSIDIADIDVGRNIGAQLQMDQAEADKRIAQAKAEERRAMAVAQEQEMKARTQEMRAEVVKAEAEVPEAMADAFRNGRLGVMDYYNMQNVIADTAMRNAISGKKPDEDKK